MSNAQNNADRLSALRENLATMPDHLLAWTLNFAREDIKSIRGLAGDPWGHKKRALKRAKEALALVEAEVAKRKA